MNTGMWFRHLATVVLAGFFLIAVLPAEAGDGFQVGVYYYPGWRDQTVGSVSATPWDALRHYPERMPVLGAYRDGAPEIVAQQIQWMADYGIDYVVFDWYWNHKLGVLKSHAIDGFFASSQRSRLKVSLMWANHTEFPQSAEQFDAMVTAWLGYFAHPEYLRIDGKPVVFIFSADQLEQKVRVFGQSGAAMLERARVIAREAGLPGIYLIGGVNANSSIVAKPGAGSGYDAMSAYNYHGPATLSYASGRRESHSYDELDAGYRDQWQWMEAHGSLPFVVPMTAGWDHRPWGSSVDPMHDESRSTASEFGVHLRAARAFMEAHAHQTQRTGVICCWNEYGEGAFIEPTRDQGFSYLEQVREVFGVAR